MNSTRSLCIALASLLAAPALRAGDVTVMVTGGKLKIVGSAAADVIAIDQNLVANAKQFRVTPGAGTTVNGVAAAALFNGVTNDISIDLGGGADQVDLTDLEAPDDVRLTVAAASTLDVDTSEMKVGGDLRADADGAIDIQMGLVRVDGDVRVRSAGGADLFGNSAFSIIKGDLVLDLGDGANVVDLDVTLVRGRVDVTTGIGADLVDLELVGIEGDQRLVLGDGADAVYMQLLTIGGDLDVKKGTGSLSLQTQVSSFGADVDLDCRNATLIAQMQACDFGDDVMARGGANNDALLIDTVSRVAGDTKVALGDGLNQAIFGESTFEGGVKYIGGSGVDGVEFHTANVQGPAKIQSGTSPIATSNVLMVSTSGLAKSLTFDGGDSDDEVRFMSSILRGTARVRLRDGANELDLFTNRFSSVDASSGAGADTMHVDSANAFDRDLKLDAGDGTNLVTVTQNTIGDDLVVRTGVGVDTVTVNGNVVGDKTDVKDAGP